MNLILTSKCNNKCSFCFAKNTLKNHQELTSEDVQIIAAYHTKNEPIKLLGGEPTLSPHFADILKVLKTVDNPVVLISNFLFKEEIRTVIEDFTVSKKLSALINISETDFHCLGEIKKNIIDGLKNDFSLAFTLNPSFNFITYRERLECFKKDFNYFSVRVSLPFPNPKKVKDFYMYKDYRYAELLVKFIKWCVISEIKISLDCGLFPCMMKDEHQENFIRQHLGDFKYGCLGVPADIINKNEIQYCYPAEFIKINIEKHINTDSMTNELRLKGKELQSLGELPLQCISCEHLHQKCPGPCLGFIKNQGEK